MCRDDHSLRESTKPSSTTAVPGFCRRFSCRLLKIPITRGPVLSALVFLRDGDGDGDFVIMSRAS